MDDDTPTVDPLAEVADPLQRALLHMLGRQADAMEDAGKTTAAEIRALGNRITLIVVLAMGLNTALVVGSMSLGVGGGRAELQVNGVDAANANVDRVSDRGLPGSVIYSPPAPVPISATPEMEE